VKNPSTKSGQAHHHRATWEKNEYAIVLPIGAIEPQLANLFTHDTYAIGDVKLGSDATVVVPEGTDLSALPQGVPIYQYDPSIVSLRQAIDSVIENRGGWHFRMNDNDVGMERAPSMLGDNDVNSPSFFREYLRENPQISFGTHLWSLRGEAYRYGCIDKLIQKIVPDGFGSVSDIPRARFEFGRNLILHHLARLQTWAEQNLPSESKGDFDRAAENVHQWLRVADEALSDHMPREEYRLAWHHVENEVLCDMDPATRKHLEGELPTLRCYRATAGQESAEPKPVEGSSHSLQT